MGQYGLVCESWLAYILFYLSEILDSGQPVLAEGFYKF